MVADACIPRKCVDALRAMGYDVMYINEIDGRMPDSQVMSIGYAFGVPIVTHDKHFKDYDNPILLKSKKNTEYLVKEIQKYMS